MAALPSLTLADARRLAIDKQRLAGPRPEPTAEAALDVVRAIRCLQLDPIQVVARSPQLVLFSRLGPYDPDLLSHLLFERRSLFEYWAHVASIVLTEDYPLFYWAMQRQRARWRPGTKRWLEANAPLRAHIRERLQAEAPLSAGDFEHDGYEDRGHADAWSTHRTVNQMLDVMWLEGELMVAGRKGQTRLWALAEDHLDGHRPPAQLDEQEADERAVALAVRALGVARPPHIRFHFMRGAYADLPGALARLEKRGELLRVAVEGGGRGPWYLHRDDLPHVEALQAGQWQPRTELLSPFDNLICDRQRTELLFDFHYRMEIYVPKAKRQYGYYVLPILHGDQFVGRLDPKLDRKQERLHILSLYAEPDAPAEAGPEIAAALRRLAGFVQAREIVFDEPDALPAVWRDALLSEL